MKDKDTYTESTKESQEQFKGLTFDKVQDTFKEFEKKMRIERANAFGIPVKINPLVPKGEIWFSNNKQEIYKIINVGNSKLYRFINWYQKLFKRISQIILKRK